MSAYLSDKLLSSHFHST